MTEFIFILSLSLLAYTYIGYPVLLFVGSLFVNRKVDKGLVQPAVTIIIPVYNEEKQIARKIENCLALEYPPDKLKIIVASDCSVDRTEEIVRGFASDRIEFVSLPERAGKVAAQNHALTRANSDIVIFTDTAISVDRDSLQRLVRNFHDRKVGAVSCRDSVILEGNEQLNGEGGYIKYDMFVRRYASRIDSLVGVTGGLYAIRKDLADGGWNPAFPPDFYAALKCIRSGFRAIEDPEVLGYYKTTPKGRDEFQRKVRTFNRGMHALFANVSLLNPFRYGFAAVALFHQKLLRWLSPFFAMALFVATCLIWNANWFMTAAFFVQMLILLLGLFAFVTKIDHKRWAFLRYPYYIFLTNAALLKAWLEFLRGRAYVMWEPTKR